MTSSPGGANPHEADESRARGEDQQHDPDGCRQAQPANGRVAVRVLRPSSRAPSERRRKRTSHVLRVRAPRRRGCASRRRVAATLVACRSRLPGPPLLVAMPQLLDPNFRRSVVSARAPRRRGHLRRRGESRPRRSLAPQRLPTASRWTGAATRRSAEIHWGGPVQPQTGWVLFDERFTDRPATSRRSVTSRRGSASPGSLDVLRQRRERSARLRLRVMLGYAGWGPGQLESELAEGAWLVAPLDDGRSSTSIPDEMWEHRGAQPRNRARHAGLGPGRPLRQWVGAEAPSTCPSTWAADVSWQEHGRGWPSARRSRASASSSLRISQQFQDDCGALGIVLAGRLELRAASSGTYGGDGLPARVPGQPSRRSPSDLLGDAALVEDLVVSRRDGSLRAPGAALPRALARSTSTSRSSRSCRSACWKGLPRAGPPRRLPVREVSCQARGAWAPRRRCATR